jgi:hypothetical protein
MGWFNKKDGAGQTNTDQAIGSLPDLPKLPELPELPDLQEKKQENKEMFHQLPSFPNSSLGQKFSQNTIKDAISRREGTNNFYPEGKKGERVFEADDFANYNQKMQKMPKPLIRPQITEQPKFIIPKTKEIEEPEEEFEMEDFQTEPMEFEEPSEIKRSDFGSYQKEEPVFIRIDKFEEALKVFEKTKKEIADIEKTIKDITQVREDEDKELESWQTDIVKIKEQIDKVDKDIFSKIE